MNGYRHSQKDMISRKLYWKTYKLWIRQRNSKKRLVFWCIVIAAAVYLIFGMGYFRALHRRNPGHEDDGKFDAAKLEVQKFWRNHIKMDCPGGVFNEDSLPVNLSSIRSQQSYFDEGIGRVIRNWGIEKRTYNKDIETFFEKHGVRPTSWENSVSPDEMLCPFRWEKTFELHPNSSFLLNYETEFLRSGCPVYPIPDGGLIYHVFWSGKWKDITAVTIDSFLVTQRLKDGHQMWFWHHNLEIPTEVKERYKPYRKYIRFVKFDFDTEAQGSCLTYMPEWYSVEYREALKFEMVSISDLVRILLLTKYGGVWVDCDSILMRDLTPLIRTGSSFFMEPNELYFNNNLMIRGPAVINDWKNVLKGVCCMRYDRAFPREFVVRPEYWYWLYNDGISKMCQSYINCSVSVNSLSFTDGMYWLAPKTEGVWACFQMDKLSFLDNLKGLWVYHARLPKEIMNHPNCLDRDKRPSHIQILKLMIESLLKSGPSLDGRILLA